MDVDNRFDKELYDEEDVLDFDDDDYEADPDFIVYLKPDVESLAINEKYSEKTMTTIYNHLISRKKNRIVSTMKKFKIENREDIRSIRAYFESGRQKKLVRMPTKYDKVKTYVFDRMKKKKNEYCDNDISAWIKAACSIYKPRRNCSSKSYFNRLKAEYELRLN